VNLSYSSRNPPIPIIKTDIQNAVADAEEQGSLMKMLQCKYASRCCYKRMEMMPTNAASKTRPPWTSDRKAFEAAVGAGGEAPGLVTKALFCTPVALALTDGEDAVVMGNPFESYDVGPTAAPAVIV
jgi:hypothetical protein